MPANLSNPDVSQVEIDGVDHFIGHSVDGILGNTFPSEQKASDAVSAIARVRANEDDAEAREEAAELCFSKQLLARRVSAEAEAVADSDWDVLALETMVRREADADVFILRETASGSLHPKGFSNLGKAELFRASLEKNETSEEPGIGF